MNRFAWALGVMGALWPGLGQARWFPPGSGVVDVRDYGAVADDGLDDTDAFQAAERASAHVGRILYVPSGVWIVSRPVLGKILHGSPAVEKWVANWILMGESREGTILRVPANSPAYANAAAPQPLLAFGSTQNDAPQTGSGGGDEAFRNSVYDLTIEVEAGNPGIRVLDWVCNNRGTIQNVSIRAVGADHGWSPVGTSALAGSVGIWAGRMYPGPCLIKDVSVEGFDRGVEDRGIYYGLVYKDVEVAGQRLYGIDANAASTTVERLHSVNTVPAIRSSGSMAQLVLIDSVLEGGAPSASALLLGAASRVFLRDVVASGYAALRKQGATVLPGLSVAEWVFPAARSLFDDPAAGSLRLPVVEPPRPFESQDPDDWADPRVYGANPADALSDQAAVQAALQSGKPIVYLPQAATSTSAYRLTGPLDVPCSVRRIVGMESKLSRVGTWPAGEPVLRLAAGCDWSDVLVVENLWSQVSPGLSSYQIEHADARTLYVRDAQIASGSGGVLARPGSGRLFLEDVVLRILTVQGPHEVWGWQLNPEGLGAGPGTLVEGATARFLGWKTEGLNVAGSPTFTCAGGARCEVLGGKLMPCVGMGTTDIEGPGFVIEDSDAALVYTNSCGKPDWDLATMDVQVRETREGVTREVFYTELPDYVVEGGHHTAMPLYVARREVCEP